MRTLSPFAGAPPSVLSTRYECEPVSHAMVRPSTNDGISACGEAAAEAARCFSAAARLSVAWRDVGARSAARSGTPGVSCGNSGARSYTFHSDELLRNDADIAATL